MSLISQTTTLAGFLRWSPLTVLVLLLSCSSPTDACACPPARTHGIVYGSVHDAAGATVNGALVQATIFSTCGEGIGELGPHPNPLQTGSDGRYRLHLHSMRGPRDACIWMIVHSPDTSVRVESDVHLRMRPESERPDSVRIDFELP